MKIQYGMTREQIEEMVEAEDWEILTEQDAEQYGEEWTVMTILQGDHAVGVDMDAEGVYNMWFIPMWELN